MLRLALLLCVLVGGMSAAAAPAEAQVTARAAAAGDDVCSELTEAHAHARALALEAESDAGVPAAARWWWGWLGTFVGLTVAQGALALAVEADDVRWPAVVGGVSSLLGIGAALISPVTTHRLSARLRELAPLTGIERLRAVERELARAADGENEGRNVFSHALGWAGAVGAGLTLWFGFDLPVQGALLAAATTVISEARIATSPTAAREAWSSYLALHPDAAACLRDEDESSARAQLPRPTFAFVPAGLGLGLVLTF